MSKKRSQNPHQRRLTSEEARRAIYIDFEGNADRSPTVLGVLWFDEEDDECGFYQDVVEECFWGAGEAHAHGSGAGNYCGTGTLAEALGALVEDARSEDRLIVAWSEHEWDIVRRYSGISAADLAEFDNRYRNAIPTARNWLKESMGPGFNFPPERRQRNGYRRWGVHWLDRYMKLIGYEVDHMKGWGQTGKRLSYLRQKLVDHGCDYEKLTPNSRSKWTNLLGHNLHDCCGMRELMLRATDGYPDGIIEPCGPCATVGSEPICPD